MAAHCDVAVGVARVVMRVTEGLLVQPQVRDFLDEKLLLRCSALLEALTWVEKARLGLGRPDLTWVLGPVNHLNVLTALLHLNFLRLGKHGHIRVCPRI